MMQCPRSLPAIASSGEAGVHPVLDLAAYQPPYFVPAVYPSFLFTYPIHQIPFFLLIYHL